MLIVATSNSFAQASFETIDGIRYLLDSDAKTAAVVASNGEKYSGEVVVPEKVKASDGKEYPVTAFADNAFKECASLTSITIPSTVTSLGEDCFSNCYLLSTIAIPNSVTSLGDGCFAVCTSLTNIVIPSSVTNMGAQCFAGCTKLASIEIPTSINELKYFSFHGCSSLISIVIPPSVSTLGRGAFYGCSSLERVAVPSSTTLIEYDCFRDCRKLQKIKIPASVERTETDIFTGCSKLETILFDGKVPAGIMASGLLSSCIIYVPKAYLQDYKDALGSKYQYIYASKEDGEDDKPMEQCATPTITYAAGKLRFYSSTPNAEYHSTITDTDMMTDKYVEDGVLELSATYHITAYATADGYQPSDKATAILYWINATLEDGTSTNVSHAKTRGIVATSAGGIVTLSGLGNGEEVRFYTLDGRQIGIARAANGMASQAAPSASLVIAKIAGQAIKIAVK